MDKGLVCLQEGVKNPFYRRASMDILSWVTLIPLRKFFVPVLPGCLEKSEFLSLDETNIRETGLGGKKKLHKKWLDKWTWPLIKVDKSRMVVETTTGMGFLFSP